MSQRSHSRLRLVVVLAGISVVASIAMAVGAWGSQTWAEDSFTTVYVVTALVAVVGGFVIVPPLLRWLAPRPNGRPPTD